MMNKNKTSQKHLIKLLLMLPLVAIMMAAFRNPNANGNTSVIMIQEDQFMLTELTYAIPDIKIDGLVKQEAAKSLLQVGKPFSISMIKKERDRLHTLLGKNGYTNISSKAISFLLDSTVSNRFAIQVNIDLKRVALSKNKINNPEVAANDILQAANHISTFKNAITKINHL